MSWHLIIYLCINKSYTSDLSLNINYPFLNLTYSKPTLKYSNLEITVRIGVGRNCLCPCCLFLAMLENEYLATAWIKMPNKSAVMQSLTSSASQLAMALIGRHSNWARFPSWIYHLNSCWPQRALVLDEHCGPRDRMPHFMWARGIKQQL